MSNFTRVAGAYGYTVSASDPSETRPRLLWYNSAATMVLKPNQKQILPQQIPSAKTEVFNEHRWVVWKEVLNLWNDIDAELMIHTTMWLKEHHQSSRLGLTLQKESNQEWDLKIGGGKSPGIQKKKKALNPFSQLCARQWRKSQQIKRRWRNKQTEHWWN